MGNPTLIPLPFRRLLFAYCPRPSSSLPFSLNLRLTHEHTETMRKTKRMLKGLKPDRHEKGECATACKMYTYVHPPCTASQGTSPLRQYAQRQYARVGGLTLSLLCIYRKSVQEKVRDAWGISYTPPG